MTAHYILYGDSPFLIDEAVQQHLRTWAKPVELLPKNLSATDLLTTVQGLSLFATGGNAYLWQEPDLMSSVGDDDTPTLCDQALKAATAHGHHFLLVLKGNLDNRRKITKVMLTHATAQPCMQLKDWEHEKWLAWVQQRLRLASDAQQRPHVSPQVAEALLATIGYDYGPLSQGIRNLMLYVGTQAPTTADVIACNAKGSASVFELLEALRMGITPKTMFLLTQLLAAGEDAIAMIGLMTSQWRLYLQILDGLHRKESFATIAKNIGRQPYYLEKLAGDIRKGYTLSKLIACLRVMHDADVAIKSGKQRPEEALLLALSRVAVPITK